VAHTIMNLVVKWNTWIESEFRTEGVLKCMTPRQFLFQFTDGDFEGVLLAKEGRGWLCPRDSLPPEPAEPAGAASGGASPTFGLPSDSPLGVPG